MDRIPERYDRARLCDVLVMRQKLYRRPLLDVSEERIHGAVVAEHSKRNYDVRQIRFFRRIRKHRNEQWRCRFGVELNGLVVRDSADPRLMDEAADILLCNEPHCYDSNCNRDDNDSVHVMSLICGA
jgi:hypothetical protein